MKNPQIVFWWSVAGALTLFALLLASSLSKASQPQTFESRIELLRQAQPADLVGAFDMVWTVVMARNDALLLNPGNAKPFWFPITNMAKAADKIMVTSTKDSYRYGKLQKQFMFQACVFEAEEIPPQ